MGFGKIAHNTKRNALLATTAAALAVNVPVVGPVIGKVLNTSIFGTTLTVVASVVGLYVLWKVLHREL